jgi:transcriptional regulator with XRE-family HTH domain
MALNIKRAIKEHGLEVRQVAAKMGITPTALSQQINGKMYKGKRVDSNPSVDVLTRIANAIGCDVVELFEPVKTEERQNTITCPHCGKKIVFSKQEEEQ